MPVLPLVGSRMIVSGLILPARSARSEEHTSELQSQSNLVCRLLLEKKKISRDDVDLRSKEYSKLLLYSSYHVKKLLRLGSDVVETDVWKGWYCGILTWIDSHCSYHY